MLLDPSSNANRFTIQIVGVDISACSKLMAMGFRPQLDQIVISSGFIVPTNRGTKVPASAPLSEKIQACQVAAISSTGAFQRKVYLLLLMK